MSYLRKCITTWASLAVVFTLGTPMAQAQSQGLGARVDLRAQQSSIKSQGRRDSCTYFAATAALEAAYGRRGITVDLSEHFFNYMSKAMWLHPWSNVNAQPASAPENQLGYSGGGNTIVAAGFLGSGFRLPAESVAPYITNYTGNEHPWMINPWNSSFWTQKRINTVNFDPRMLDRSMLTARTYYGATGYRALSGAGGATALLGRVIIELNQGREVMVGVRHNMNTVRNASVRNARIVDVCQGANCPMGNHAMLAVGYDRTASNPANHYVILKNSWGPQHRATRNDGFTYVSLGYMRQYLTSGAVLTGAADPAPWYGLSFFGRWNLNYDGHKGQLDIYKVPGVMDHQTRTRDGGLKDRRIGTFYDASGKAHRVNGSITGKRIVFHIDAKTRNPAYDALKGRTFYYAQTTDSKMAIGFHRDPNGSVWGGFMTRDRETAFAAPPRVNGRTWQTSGGTWDVYSGAGHRMSHISLGTPRGTNTPTAIAHGRSVRVEKRSGEERRSLVFRDARGKLIGHFKRLSWDANVATGNLRTSPSGRAVIPVVFVKRQ